MISDFYNKLFTVYRMVWANDMSAYNVVGQISGYTQQINAELSESYGLSFTKAFSVWCDLTANVAVADKLVVDGKQYLVKAIIERPDGSNPHLELVCERIENFNE